MCSSQTCKGCFTMFKIKSAIFRKPLHPSAHLKLVKMSSKIITNGKASGNQSENAIVGALIMEKSPFFLSIVCTWFSEHCQLLTCLAPAACFLADSECGRIPNDNTIYLSVFISFEMSPGHCTLDPDQLRRAAGSIRRAPRSDLRIPRRGSCCWCAAAWCHMEQHAAPPRTNCTLDAACYFPILLLCCFPAQPLLCRSQSLLCMSRVDIYLLIYAKRTCQCQLGVEKCWNASRRPHQTSAKDKKSTCRRMK